MLEFSLEKIAEEDVEILENYIPDIRDLVQSKDPADILEMIDDLIIDVSEERWKKYIEMMLDCGYIKGVTAKTYVSGCTVVDCQNIQITLKGLEYLQENSMMQKIYKTMEGIKDVVPAI